MWSEYLIFSLLPFLYEIAAEDGTERLTRQADDDCAQCENLASMADELLIDGIPTRKVGCQCSEKSSDTSPSMLLVSNDPPISLLDESRESDEKSKRLLHPEVDFASSVLRTLHEATDEELKEKLEKNHESTLENEGVSDFMKDSIPTETKKNIFAIILNSKETNDDYRDIEPEASNNHETQCANESCNTDLKTEQISKQFDLKPLSSQENNGDETDTINAEIKNKETAVQPDKRHGALLSSDLFRNILHRDDFKSHPLQKTSFDQIPNLKPSSLFDKINKNDRIEDIKDMIEQKIKKPVLSLLPGRSDDLKEHLNIDKVEELAVDSLDSASKINKRVSEFPPKPKTQSPFNDLLQQLQSKLDPKNLLRLNPIELLPPIQLEKTVLPNLNINIFGNDDNAKNAKDETKPQKKNILDLLSNGLKLNFNTECKGENKDSVDKALSGMINQPNTVDTENINNIENTPKNNLEKKKEVAETKIIDSLPNASDLNNVVIDKECEFLEHHSQSENKCNPKKDNVSLINKIQTVDDESKTNGGNNLISNASKSQKIVMIGATDKNKNVKNLICTCKSKCKCYDPDRVDDDVIGHLKDFSNSENISDDILSGNQTSLEFDSNIPDSFGDNSNVHELQINPDENYDSNIQNNPETNEMFDISKHTKNKDQGVPNDECEDDTVESDTAQKTAHLDVSEEMSQASNIKPSLNSLPQEPKENLDNTRRCLSSQKQLDDILTGNIKNDDELDENENSPDSDLQPSLRENVVIQSPFKRNNDESFLKIPLLKMDDLFNVNQMIPKPKSIDEILGNALEAPHRLFNIDKSDLLIPRLNLNILEPKEIPIPSILKSVSNPLDDPLNLKNILNPESLGTNLLPSYDLRSVGDVISGIPTLKEIGDKMRSDVENILNQPNLNLKLYRGENKPIPKIKAIKSYPNKLINIKPESKISSINNVPQIANMKKNTLLRYPKKITKAKEKDFGMPSDSLKEKDLSVGKSRLEQSVNELIKNRLSDIKTFSKPSPLMKSNQNIINDSKIPNVSKLARGKTLLLKKLNEPQLSIKKDKQPFLLSNQLKPLKDIKFKIKPATLRPPQVMEKSHSDDPSDWFDNNEPITAVDKSSEKFLFNNRRNNNDRLFSNRKNDVISSPSEKNVMKLFKPKNPNLMPSTLKLNSPTLKSDESVDSVTQDKIHSAEDRNEEVTEAPNMAGKKDKKSMIKDYFLNKLRKAFEDEDTLMESKDASSLEIEDMINSPSSNIEVEQNKKESLKENTSYRCRLVCSKE